MKKPVYVLVMFCISVVATHRMHNWERRSTHSRVKRQDQNVRNCDARPPIYPDTTEFTAVQLERLREEMRIRNLDAYIIPSEDAHGSEYIAEHDQRRQYISGFTGSAGLAIVTRTVQNQNAQNAQVAQAALWTDGRYFLQAKMELDCNWQDMESGEIGVPTPQEWLSCENEVICANLRDSARVGVDPLLISATEFLQYVEQFSQASKSVHMVPVEDNLVDIVWNDLGEQPMYPGIELIILPTEITGRSWQAKIFYDDPNIGLQTIRQALRAREAKALVVSKLDEVAWIFNLRGEDIPYNPMFISYAIISLDWIRLYMYQANTRLDPQRYRDVREHLELDSCSGTKDCIQVKAYEDFIDDLTDIGKTNAVWFSDTASYAIYNAVIRANRIMEASPILLMKAVKNQAEREGMRSASIKDSVSICELASWVQERIDNLQDKVNGDLQYLSEIKVAEEAIMLREDMWSQEFIELSFATISAFKEHAAIIHYNATEQTNIPITTGGTFLLDTGAHYKDGTTDITRTFHYGKPTAFMREAYTRVLMGHIDLAQAVFRSDVYGSDLDALARGPLWAGGLDYRHGTGHGIGHFLNVHEGPIRIAHDYSENARAFQVGMVASDDPINIGSYQGEEPLDIGLVVSNGNQGIKTKCLDPDRNEPFEIGAFLSDEPGYYEEGLFGIRLENDLEVVMAETEYTFSTYSYMTFNVISLVPFEPNLIDFSMLSRKQIDWYNAYNERILREIYPHPMLSQRARQWIKDKTFIVTYEYRYNGDIRTSAFTLFTAIISILTVLFLQN